MLNIRVTLSTALLFVVQASCATASASDRILVWSDDGDGNRIEQAGLDGSNRFSIVTDLGSPTAIAFNPTTSLLYWIDNNSDTIESVELDGSNREIVISSPTIIGTPLGLAIDSVGNRIYWSDNSEDSIWSADLDGANPQLVISSVDLGGPAGIFVDNITNKLYWLDAGRGELGRSDLDGSSVEILANGFNLLQELVVDHTNKRVLFTDLNLDALLSYDLATNLTSTLLSITDPTGLALDPVTGQIYIAESDTDTIRRVESDGTGLTTIIGTGLSNPYGLAVITIPLSGDLNDDGFVGIEDLNIILSDWNQNVPPANTLADPSGDGFVGIEDLNIVLENWNAGCLSNNVSVVPEPTTLILTVFSAVTMLRRDRSKGIREQI